MTKTKETENAESVELPNVQNISKLMEFDALAYQNNIGSVIDRVTNLWGIEQTDENREKIQKYIKIMDIVGQLTIDAAKTGEFEPIPTDIETYLKIEKILKPYFMRYLPKNERKLKAEQMGIENADFFFDGQEDVRNNQLKFSDENISLNRICHYMEKKIAEIDNKVVENEFDLDKFLKIFVIEKPNETSNLYINIKKRLIELAKENADLYKQLADDNNSDDSKAERMSHYRYFYIYARNELLKICKLSEEKSVNKVLNCIVYMCYREPDFMDNDCAKNILWNCFEREMIRRAKENYTDSNLDFSTVVSRAEKTKELKDSKLAKYQKKRDFHIVELEDKNKTYSQIIIRDEDIDYILDTVSEENLAEYNISTKHTEELQKLYAVLMVISKYMESDRPVGKNKKICHFINPLTIHDNRNNGLNFSNISKLCDYTDYQRKNVKKRLKELHKLGAISISQTRTDNIRFKVNYEKIEPKEYDISLIEMSDYKKACTDILNCI